MRCADFLLGAILSAAVLVHPASSLAKSKLSRHHYHPPLDEKVAPGTDKDRRCRRNRDCVFRPRLCGFLKPCTDQWQDAVNRKTARHLVQRFSVMRPSCQSNCRTAARGRRLGTKAVCIKRRCHAFDLKAPKTITKQGAVLQPTKKRSEPKGPASP